jgi:hypothetical protein
MSNPRWVMRRGILAGLGAAYCGMAVAQAITG